MIIYIIYQMCLGLLRWAKVVPIANVQFFYLPDHVAVTPFSTISYQWVFFIKLNSAHLKSHHHVSNCPIILISYQHTPKYMKIKHMKYLFDIFMGTFWLKTRRVLDQLNLSKNVCLSSIFQEWEPYTYWNVFVTS